MLNEITTLAEKHKDFPLLAIVLFNSSHAHLISVLKNETYINALEEITGREICTFWAALQKGKTELPDMPRGSMGMMVPIYKEPSENKSLYKYFGIDDGRSLPLLITFTYGKNGELFYSKTKLVDTSSENAFNKLREVLTEKSELICDFSSELKSDKEKLFYELNIFDSANKATEAFSSLLKLIPILKFAKSI